MLYFILTDARIISLRRWSKIFSQVPAVPTEKKNQYPVTSIRQKYRRGRTNELQERWMGQRFLVNEKCMEEMNFPIKFGVLVNGQILG